MSVSESVDATLQIIAGLAAAHAVGILHRDIKPANCFLSGDGSVKVGDFGLAVSTPPTTTIIKGIGQRLGTPGFASPEQSRGQSLDLRSDIFSVGATLYYLLTKRVPFQATDFAELPKKTAKRPHEIPHGLFRVILRCLEEDRNKRFNNYDELREALLPYSSTAATPNTLGLRFTAFCIDGSLLTVVIILSLLLLFPDVLFQPDIHLEFRDVPLKLMNDAFGWRAFILFIVYFGIFEGFLGITFGKLLCGLRVATLDDQKPGFPRALLRVTLFLLLTQGPLSLLFASMQKLVPSLQTSSGYKLFPVYIALGLLSYVLPFLTVPRRFRFAALYDIVSGTQVIRKPSSLGRCQHTMQLEKLSVEKTARCIGPYEVLEVLQRTHSEELLLCQDPKLRRKVWVRCLPDGTPPVSMSIRDLSRVGRCRWLNGKRSTGDSWDAYEATQGEAFLNLVRDPQPWDRVRFWLLDIAEELNAGLRDRSVAEGVLNLDRIWITAERHAKLLDFVAPGVCANQFQSNYNASMDGTSICHDARDPHEFLRQVSMAALAGRLDNLEDPHPSTVAIPLPCHARNLLAELEAGLTPALVAERLRPLVGKPPSVTRTRRLGMLAVSSVVPVFFALCALFYYKANRVILWNYPEIPFLGVCLTEIQKLGPVSQTNSQVFHERQALEVYVARHFPQDIARSPFIRLYASVNDFITPEQVDLAGKLFASRGTPSGAELKEANSVAGSLLTKKEYYAILSSAEPCPACIKWSVALFTNIFVIIPALIAAVSFRGGLVMHVLRVAVVQDDGMPASRMRTLFRSFIGAFLFLYLLIPPFIWRPPFSRSFLVHFLAVGIPVVLLIVIALSAVLPGRGIQDRLARTYLVPR